MKIGDRFTARMHESLFKPEGFKKKARTFSRVHLAYGEHYNLQGSAWNSPDAPWRFYVNCGISFPDIPETGTHFPTSTRLGVFVRGSPPEFDVTDDNLEQLVAELTGYLRQCFSYFSRRHEVLRDSFLQRKYHHSFLYDPELQEG